MTELATTNHGTLAVVGDQIDWSPEQRAAFAHIGIEDAPDPDKQVFHHVCRITGLDPYRRQIYMIGRPEKQEDGTYRKKWTIQTAIDGFRVVAEEHPQYAGTLDPEWCGPDGEWRETWTDPRPPVMARVKVLRHDRAHPITLPLRFNEFAATFKNGDLRAQWREKPAHMIAKCAEAAALRKAFPQQLAGVYTDDEMAHTDNPAARRGVVVEQDAKPVTAAELTGQPQPDVWDATRWTAEVDAAYAAHDDARVNDLWNRAAKERPDDTTLRDSFTEASHRHGRKRTAPADVVDAEVIDPDPDGDRTDEYIQAMADEDGTQ